MLPETSSQYLTSVSSSDEDTVTRGVLVGAITHLFDKSQTVKVPWLPILVTPQRAVHLPLRQIIHPCTLKCVNEHLHIFLAYGNTETHREGTQIDQAVLPVLGLVFLEKLVKDAVVELADGLFQIVRIPQGKVRDFGRAFLLLRRCPP